MNKFLVLTVLVAAATAAELGLDGLKPSELKEIEKEIAAGNVPPNYVAEKPKRGAKLGSADNSNFNYLSNSIKPINSGYTLSLAHNAAYSQAQQAFPQSQAYTPAAATTNQATPNAQASAYPQPAYNNQYRLVYPNQYQYQNPFLSQIQNPYIASQIAAQYAYQPALPHFVQTPNQLQYVSPNNYQQVPSANYKALTSKAPTATVSADGKTTTTEQQQATSQVVLPSNMAYQQQPQYQIMYLIPQQTYNPQQQYLYPGHQQMLLVSPQSPLLNYFNQQRFGAAAYNTPQTTQLAYLQQPQLQQYQTLQQASPDTTSAANAANSAQQKPINVQEVSDSNNYGLRTKA